MTALATHFAPARAARLTDRDTIVVADFTNTTGDAVFDETLRQGLTVQLQQSPFLSLVADQRIRKALSLMGQPEARLSGAVARQVCERTGAAAVLEGSISSLGNQYVLGLRATNCSTGDVLAEEQAQAGRKEDVLTALSQIASTFRTRVGESLASVRQLAKPLPEGTTASLEALKAYSIAMKANYVSGKAAAIPLFKRAIELDPQFALAWAHLGLCYSATGESVLARESTTTSYELRDRTSDGERFFITAMYDRQVTGNLAKSLETLRAWTQTYPRDSLAFGLLAGFSTNGSGRYEESIAAALKAIALEPTTTFPYVMRAQANVYLGRFGEAEKALRAAEQAGVNLPELTILRYHLAFLNDDSERMQQITSNGDQPGLDHWLGQAQALVMARSGRLRAAGVITERAANLARQQRQLEIATIYEASGALSEALFEARGDARRRAQAVLKLSRGRETQYTAALALALTGDLTQARALADDLDKRFPEDTSVQFSYLPTLRALSALSGRDPAAALDILRTAERYEFAVPATAFYTFFGALYPNYVRGLALLATNQPAAAATEFQRIIDHRGLLPGDPMDGLARLQLARALRRSGDGAGSKRRYEDVLELWRNADPDLPVIKQARLEYSALNDVP